MASTARLPRLRQESLAQKAFRELKGAILSGRLEPGAPLGEVELAEALGISRTPVREAIAQLRSAGFVEGVPGGGNVVRSLAADEVRELFLLREALECLALREWVGLAAADRDVEALRKILDRQRRAAKSSDVERFLAADEDFHLTLCRQARLPQVADLLLSLREKMRQAGLRAVTRPDRMPAVLDEHQAIVDALVAGSTRKATSALVDHLDATRDAFDSVL